MNTGLVDWMQYLLSFALVIGLLLGSLWMLRKLQSGNGLRPSGAKRLKVVETLSIGPRQKNFPDPDRWTGCIAGRDRPVHHGTECACPRAHRPSHGHARLKS